MPSASRTALPPQELWFVILACRSLPQRAGARSSTVQLAEVQPGSQRQLLLIHSPFSPQSRADVHTLALSTATVARANTWSMGEVSIDRGERDYVGVDESCLLGPVLLRGSLLWCLEEKNLASRGSRCFRCPRL
jgi:hypothetical protein